MPHRRFDWHEYIKNVEGKYQAARLAVDRLKAGLVATPEFLQGASEARAFLRAADKNLEGTYLVRLFAAFEAALRSFDRARHNDPARSQDASVTIDTIGGRRGHGISAAIRQGAHAVRQVRNFWAHENDAPVEPIPINIARAMLPKYLSWLPEEWG